MTTAHAKFQSLGRDLYWTHCVWSPEFEILRWGGYDDAYWWNTVSKSDTATVRTAKDGKRYRLDPQTNSVTAEQESAPLST
jgi:hypothetical protein